MKKEEKSILKSIYLVTLLMFFQLSISFGKFDFLPIILGLSSCILIAYSYFIISRFFPSGDKYLLILSSFIAQFGLVMIYRLNSQSPVRAIKQISFFTIGIAAYIFLVIFLPEIKKFERFRYVYIIITIVLLSSTLFLGREIKGSKNWIQIGPFNMQPSEIAKLFLILYLSSSIKYIKNFYDALKESIPVFISIGLLVVEKDLGAGLIFFGIYITMLYIGTSNFKYILSAVIIFLLGGLGSYFIFPHVKVRVDIWLNPFAYKTGKGYQICQSLFAIAAGGLFGTGLGFGYPQFIPEVHNDFIFSAICEEFGLLGASALILLYILLVYRGLRTAIYAKDDYSRLVAVGISSMLAFQIFVVIGGVTKMIPMTGITLPFVSYGGSSMLLNFICLGVLQKYLRAGGKRMNNKNLVRNIKILIIFFCICFFGIIFYLTYFNLYVSQKIINDNSNPRIKAEENKRLRGLIFDRDGDVLVYSKRLQNGNQKRYYKYGEVYAHITGYSSAIYGKSGIELAYNDVLSGKTLIYNNPISAFKKFLDVVMNKEKKGNNIFLTIDDKLQQKTYSLLGDNIGAAVAINPKTGEILSMVSKPSFNPEKIDEKFEEYNSDSIGVPFLNRAAKGYYPPGSTFKIITASAALNYIDNIENNSFNCNGKLKIGDYILNDYNKESHGKINLKNAFKVSCNYTFGSIGMKLGYDKLKDMAENFMFNKDIPLNDEYDSINIKEGKIKIENDKSLALTAQDAIGQHGVTSNPMHMALIAASIANEGTMMKPYIVKQIRDDYNNVLYEGNPKVLKNCIDKKIADKVKDYMIEVVKSGTGTNAKINGITVAGKTGTAQVEGKNETHSWFVAFAPAQDPKIAVAVIVENGGVGGGTAARIVREMIKTYLKK